MSFHDYIKIFIIELNEWRHHSKTLTDQGCLGTRKKHFNLWCLCLSFLNYNHIKTPRISTFLIWSLLEGLATSQVLPCFGCKLCVGGRWPADPTMGSIVTGEKEMLVRKPIGQPRPQVRLILYKLETSPNQDWGGSFKTARQVAQDRRPEDQKYQQERVQL